MMEQRRVFNASSSALSTLHARAQVTARSFAVSQNPQGVMSFENDDSYFAADKIAQMQDTNHSSDRA
jgi:hypothetical protein